VIHPIGRENAKKLLVDGEIQRMKRRKEWGDAAINVRAESVRNNTLKTLEG
jgi:hypothetical protein